ncbi:hypothetical protein SAMN05216251_113112 [Actinacidiphila alni]|uniref:Uncharacterized protein n=1 Tax=Actinacidiphila alni TaxID=380248 RepID=A0A1I2IE31_9ACTN|nr:hypothetical protein [Actinacidiphila alni]SFF40484.1 hypothetical protein SAMN05216251_113112 [Actinacidiphila alni]
MSIPPPLPPLPRKASSRLALPSWKPVARAALLGAVGSYTGTVLTARAWSDCPLGNDSGENFALTGLMVEMCFLMTACLLVVELSWWALSLPLPVLRWGQWLVPVAVAVGLTALYRIGMQSPVVHPDGSCWEGYPAFPFEPKPGPH